MSTRIAVFFTGAWGDLYISTAALKEVVDRHSTATVSLIGTKRWLDIIDPATWPTIQHIVVTENGWSGEHFSLDKNLQKWIPESNSPKSLVRFLKGFETTYNLRTESFRFAWAPFFARVPNRFGSAPPGWGWLYSENSTWLGKDPLIHERDRLLKVVEGHSSPEGLIAKWSRRTLPPLKTPHKNTLTRYGLEKFTKYILINPTASRTEKAWPAAKFRELCLQIHKELSKLKLAADIGVVVIGAPNETEWLKAVTTQVTLLVQPKSIADLIDVVGLSSLVVTNVSSLQFLANGFNVKTLTLVGRAKPEVWGPLGENSLAIVSPLKPDNGRDVFEDEVRLYSAIEVESVFEKVRQFLQTLAP